MNRRKEFYKANPAAANFVTSGEERGEMRAERIIYSADDYIPLSIEYVPEIVSKSQMTSSKSNHATRSKVDINSPASPQAIEAAKKYRQKRYLHCKAGVRIWHLKKLLRQKYEL